MPGSKLVMKILTLVLRIPIAIAIRKLVERAFVSLRPAAQKREAKEGGVRIADALTWAALTGAGVAAAQLVSRKGAEETFRVITGNEPPPPPPTKEEKKAAKKAAKEQKKHDRELAKALS